MRLNQVECRDLDELFTSNRQWKFKLDLKSNDLPKSDSGCRDIPVLGSGRGPRPGLARWRTQTVQWESERAMTPGPGHSDGTRARGCCWQTPSLTRSTGAVTVNSVQLGRVLYSYLQCRQYSAILATQA